MYTLGFAGTGNYWFSVQFRAFRELGFYWTILSYSSL